MYILYNCIDFCTNLYYIYSMNETKYENLNKNDQEIIKKIEEFIGDISSSIESDNLTCIIKEMCVKKLCEVVGIKCGCNFKNPYFNFFGCVMGQALCNKLKIRLTIAPAGLRLIKYDGINFVSKAEEYLEGEDVDEAFIDVFDLTDDHKEIIDKINWEQY